MSNALWKYPGETPLFDIDLSDYVPDGDSVQSVVSIDDDDSVLTYGAPSISGTTVQIGIGGGVSGVYNISIVFNTTLGSQNLEAHFNLMVV